MAWISEYILLIFKKMFLKHRWLCIPAVINYEKGRCCIVISSGTTVVQTVKTFRDQIEVIVLMINSRVRVENILGCRRGGWMYLDHWAQVSCYLQSETKGIRHNWIKTFGKIIGDTEGWRNCSHHRWMGNNHNVFRNISK